MTVLLLALGIAACSDEPEPAAPPTPRQSPTLSIPTAGPPTTSDGNGRDSAKKNQDDGASDDGASDDGAGESRKDLTPKEQRAADAAIAAFKKYLRVSDAVMRDGGRHPERLKTVATGIVLAGEQGSARGLRSKHHHITGNTQSYQFRVKHVNVGDANRGSRSRVKIAVCVDVSDVDVVGTDGKSVLPADRPNVISNRFSILRDVPDGKWLVSTVAKGSNKC